MGLHHLHRLCTLYRCESHNTPENCLWISMTCNIIPLSFNVLCYIKLPALRTEYWRMHMNSLGSHFVFSFCLFPKQAIGFHKTYDYIASNFQHVGNLKKTLYNIFRSFLMHKIIFFLNCIRRDFSALLPFIFFLYTECRLCFDHYAILHPMLSSTFMVLEMALMSGSWLTNRFTILVIIMTMHRS